MPSSASPSQAATGLSQLSAHHWRGGIAAWLGWLFDGLDGYLFPMVAMPLVIQLTHGATPKQATPLISYIQAGFLVGWALGGTVFGRIGDRIGRSRTLALSILTYALFTGLCSFAPTWQLLFLFKFIAALGIGGEWAAGSSLVSETWPRKWRPWASAVLQSAYQCGVLLAAVAAAVFAQQPRWVFLVGALPALVVFWIRRSIPETEEWTRAAKAAQSGGLEEQSRDSAPQPGILDLFKPPVLRTTVLTVLVCSASLTTVWALLFWFPQQLRQMPEIHRLPLAAQTRFVTQVTLAVTSIAILGNFFAGAIARWLGYRAATAVMFVGALFGFLEAYGVPRDSHTILVWLGVAHFFSQGVFGLFPLYIPPLFPTLLRTTGAGFSYNIGRIVAAIGTIIFGVFAHVNNFAQALVWVAWLYVPALLIAALIPEPPRDEPVTGAPAAARA